MSWIKNNNVWNYELPNVNTSIIQGNSKNITSPNNKYIYIPTHNINDVYENYRLFKDAYLYNNNTYYDPKSFAIQGYFDNNRAQSIQGWFPNLVEVKATSSNTYKYYIDTINNEYNRSSIDYLQSLTISNPIIDGVNIYTNDKVLLKNQNYDILQTHNIDSTLTENINNINSYFIPITNSYNYSDYIKINGELIIFDINNNVYKDIITNVIFTNTHIEIQTQKQRIINAIKIADSTNGEWINVLDNISNGIYEYNGFEFNPIPAMYNEFKLYNQIVYTYLGETNQNKQYYLRRNEIKFNNDFGKFPVFGVNDFIYSEANAHLIKCLIDYDLNLNDNIVDLSLLSNCCECIINNINLNAPTHPNYIGPFLYDDNAYRLLYLDNDVAKRIYVTDNNGLRQYNYIENNPLDYNINFKFNLQDINNINNVLYDYIELKYTSAIFPYLNNNITFYNNNTHNLDVTIEIDDIFNSNNTILGNDEVTVINVNNFNDMNDTIPFDEKFSKISIINNITGEIIVSYDVFTVHNSSKFYIYRQLDNIIVDEIKALLNDNISNISVKLTAQTSFNNTTNLLNTQIQNFFISQFYDIYFNNDGTVIFNGIKQNNIIKWANYGTSIDDNITINTIEHNIEDQYRLYFYDYSLDKYINTYMALNNTSVNTDIYNVTVLNITGNDNRFGIEGSTKNIGEGNYIYFGKNYKNLLNLNIDTLLQITNNTTITTFKTTIDSIEWYDDLEFGKIVLSRSIIYPSNGDSISIQYVTDINEISQFINDVTNKKVNIHNNTLPEYKINTAGTAYLLTNINDLNKYDILNNITGIMFKEFNEPRLMLFKRDKSFKFNNDEITQVQQYTNTDIDINDIFPLYNPGDLVLVTGQNNLNENGIYLVNNSNNLIPQNVQLNHYYEYGNISKIALYNVPFQLGISNVIFIDKDKSTKYDPRLTLKPVAIAQLGVDNKTAEWKNINTKYDIQEIEENVFNISPGINSINEIRFIDGLSAYKIINNIDGQGQYSWILEENVITENAVVGCTQINGPGTGDLIWYKGTWVDGVWCNGIWIQGLWKNGIWVNGTHNAYPIIDNYYYITYNQEIDTNLSIWENGIWLNGIWNGGLIQNITWYNGIFNSGIITEGIWYNGTFNYGIIENIIWHNGLFNGGEFKTGIWYNGIFNEINPTYPSIFGSGSYNSSLYSTRAIWFFGKFLGGIFTTGDTHNCSIFYSGEFKGNFNGGTYVSGTFDNSNFNNGIYLGGYKTTITQQSGITTLNINPAQYDNLLGLDTLTGYIPNTKHNINYPIYLTANATDNSSNFMKQTFINQWYDNYITTYIPYIGTNITDTTIDIITNTMPILTYITNPIDESPFICTRFIGNFYNGTWLNGYFEIGNFYNGIWINGFALNVNFGNI